MISRAKTFDNLETGSLEYYKNIFRLMPNAFQIFEFIFDENNKPIDFQTLYVNPAFEKQTGLKAESALNKTLLETLPDIERVWIDEHFQNILKKKSYQFIEYNHNTKKHYQATTFSITKTQYATIFEDITNTIQIQQELNESENNFKKYLSPIHEMHVMLELDYDENEKVIDYKILKVNTSFEKLTNLNKSVLEGKSAKSVFGDLIYYWTDQFEQVDKLEQPIVLEQHMTELRKYYNNSAWKVGEGKIACIGTDITVRKKQELELIRRREEAKKNNRLKSAFLANMSHEIRTPMNGILGFTSLLQNPNITGPELLEYTNIIQRSGKRMLNIINDIVDISKIESGMTELYITESNLNDQIDYLYTFFKPEVEAKGLQLFYTCALANEHSVVLTDREKLFAILTNLIKNAIKNTDEGSIEFGYEINSGRLEFYVKDTGIGIPESEQSIIFDRFRQVKNPNNKVIEGTGLGLAISKAYIEMLGGEIWVESEPLNGTLFKFSLQKHKDDKNNIEKLAETTSIANLETKKLKVVVADDDPISNDLLKILLRQKGHDIIQVKNGQEAVDAMRSTNEIDLVLMDIRMPLLSGYEATAQIRTFNNESVIIAQTAFSIVGDREKAIKSGCNDYLTKPIDKNLLYDLIDVYFKE